MQSKVVFVVVTQSRESWLCEGEQEHNSVSGWQSVWGPLGPGELNC